MNFGRRQKQAQKQKKQRQKMAQDQLVVYQQLLLNQMRNCQSACDALLDAFEDNADAEIVGGICALTTSALSIFGSMIKDMRKAQDQRGMDLSSRSLKQWFSGQSKERQKVLEPFICYLQLALTDGVKVRPIPAHDADDDDFDQNKFLGQYLGGQHQVELKVADVQKEWRQIDKVMENEWKRMGRERMETVKKPYLPKAPDYYSAVGVGFEWQKKGGKGTSLGRHLHNQSKGGGKHQSDADDHKMDYSGAPDVSMYEGYNNGH